MSARLVVRRSSPFRRWIAVAAAVPLVLAALYAAFVYGGRHADREVTEQAVELRLLAEAVNSLRAENEALRGTAARLERSGQVEQQAYEGVEDTLKALQTERLELKEEVAFYSSIVADTDRSGLQIRRLSLRPDGNGGFRYSLVLTRDMKNDKVISGRVRLRVSGRIGGAEKSVDIADTAEEGALQLHIKHFQKLEGSFTLPEGFQPASLSVRVKPDGKQSKLVEENYDWRSIAG